MEKLSMPFIMCLVTVFLFIHVIYLFLELAVQIPALQYVWSALGQDTEHLIAPSGVG